MQWFSQQQKSKYGDIEWDVIMSILVLRPALTCQLQVTHQQPQFDVSNLTFATILSSDKNHELLSSGMTHKTSNHQFWSTRETQKTSSSKPHFQVVPLWSFVLRVRLITHGWRKHLHRQRNDTRGELVFSLIQRNNWNKITSRPCQNDIFKPTIVKF